MEKYKYTENELSNLMLETTLVLKKILSFLSEGYKFLSGISILGVQNISYMNECFKFFGASIMEIEKLLENLDKIQEQEYVESILNNGENNDG